MAYILNRTYEYMDHSFGFAAGGGPAGAWLPGGGRQYHCTLLNTLPTRPPHQPPPTSPGSCS